MIEVNKFHEALNFFQINQRSSVNYDFHFDKVHAKILFWHYDF